MSFWRNLILSAAFIVLSIPSFAQKKTEQVDSLVNLLSAQSMELIEKYGVNYRKVTGPARFLHNNTYLICDTALWNVNQGEIEAWGHVKILQNETVLTSDKLTYVIDDDLAKFRGTVVQLEDKDRNTLRTKHLDYNTKDSVAVFRNGASMKDKEGQIIESLNGTYDSKIKLFTFTDNVNMFTDSIFVKTTRLEYNTDKDFATFGRNTDAWKEDDMLSADAGWYDRRRETFFFNNKVHVMTHDQEAWSDSLFFKRNTMDVEMLGNVQITDTTRNASAVAGRLEYIDSLAQVTLTRDPAIIGVTDSTGTARDTVYLGGDVLRMRSFMKFEIDTLEYINATKRLEDINSDAVGAYRKAAYEEARRAAEEAKKNDADYQAEQEAKAKRDALAQEGAQRAESQVGAEPPAEEPDEPEPPAEPESPMEPEPPIDQPSEPDVQPDPMLSPTDSLGLAGNPLLPPADSLGMAGELLLPPADSLLAGTDSLSMVPAAPKDSTKVSFLEAIGKVRLYREDFQMRCDSLKFNELDSLVRLHKEPLVWNEGNRQYASDSIYVSFGNNNLDKAYLMSNAFVMVEEAPECYDQIRSTEMLAFFDEEGLLRRFDALGGSDAIFYLQEDSTFATVNKSQSKLLSATFRAGELEAVDYYENPKNNAYPLAQMKKDDRILKGFNWLPDLRPSGPKDITDYVPRETQRKMYAARPRAQFRQTDIYFPGYMSGVYKKIEEKERKAQERRNAEELAKQEPGSTGDLPSDLQDADGNVTDAEPVTGQSDDGTGNGDLAAQEGGNNSGTDGSEAGDLEQGSDDGSGTMVPDTTDVPSSQPSEKELLKKQREDARLAKIAERDAKWARLDSLDAAKAAAKAEKLAEKERQKKLKVLKARSRQDEKDAARLEKYRLRYEQRSLKKSKPEAVKEKKPSIPPPPDSD